MYEQLNTVKIGGKELPIKCNISILAYIQDTFVTLKRFEQKLIGVNPILDKNGNNTYREDGSLIYTQLEPSIKVLIEVVPKLINEGIKQAEENGDDCSDLEWESAFDEFDFDLYEVAIAIDNEFKRCFYRKKKMTNTKKSRRQTAKKSTSME